MNVSSPARRARNEPNTGFLYGWLLLCLFLEYARPASFFPFLNIPSLYSILPLLLFVVSLFVPGLRSAKEAFSDKQAKWIFALLGVVFLSFAIFRSYAIDVFTSVLGYVLLFMVIARVCTTWDRVRGVVKMLLFAHVFLLAMNLEVLLDPSIRQYIKGATFLGDGNDFGLSICLLFPLGLWLAQTSPSKFGKVLNYAVLLLLLYAIVATQSRGATLGIGAMFFFLWLYSRRKAVGAVAMVVAAVGVIAFAPSAYSSRMSTLTNPTDGSAQGRIDAWKAGIGMGARNPLIGVGAGHFGPRWGKTAHSTYVLAFGELGIPGFICVLAVVIGNARSTINLRKRIAAASAPPPEAAKVVKPKGARNKDEEAPPAETRQEWVMRALLYSAGAMIGFGVAGAFLSATYYPHLYVLTGLMVATRALASQEAGVVVDAVKARARPFNRQSAEPVPAAGRNDARKP
jgi:putative inorganic carbon (hco3(-)) transporter